MTRRWKCWLVLVSLGCGLAAFSGCRITPSVNMGVGVDYYGGSFHARPYANVGLHGHP